MVRNCKFSFHVVIVKKRWVFDVVTFREHVLKKKLQKKLRFGKTQALKNHNIKIKLKKKHQPTKNIKKHKTQKQMDPSKMVTMEVQRMVEAITCSVLTSLPEGSSLQAMIDAVPKVTAAHFNRAPSVKRVRKPAAKKAKKTDDSDNEVPVKKTKNKKPTEDSDDVKKAKKEESEDDEPKQVKKAKKAEQLEKVKSKKAESDGDSDDDKSTKFKKAGKKAGSDGDSDDDKSATKFKKAGKKAGSNGDSEGETQTKAKVLEKNREVKYELSESEDED